MTIEASIDRLDEARSALALRSDREILDALCGVIEIWRDPNSRTRRQLENELPALSGFAPATLRAGLEVGFAPWTAQAFRSLVHGELASVRGNAGLRGHDRTSVVLAGSIPMPSLLSLLLPLVLRSPVLCRAASRDPVTPRLVVESLGEVDPLLAAAVEIAEFDKRDEDARRAFFSAPCVVATGSDETIKEIASFLGPAQRFVRYRHRVSLAVVDLRLPDADLVAKWSQDLALDIGLWDQLGCLSPIAIYAVGPQRSAGQFAETLARAMKDLERRLPRGEVLPEIAALIRGQRSEAEMRAALGNSVEVYASAGSTWTVILEADTQLRPAPLQRFIRIMPVPDLSQLDAALRPLAPHLAGVALAGFADTRDKVEGGLEALGASRICAPGELQAPPFSWPRDNQPVLLPLGLPNNDEEPPDRAGTS